MALVRRSYENHLVGGGGTHPPRGEGAGRQNPVSVGHSNSLPPAAGHNTVKTDPDESRGCPSPSNDHNKTLIPK